jgi:virulence factor Mce-like protein
MNKRSVGSGQLTVIVLFALTTFGLLLYLWLAFGGASPLAPKGYRFTVDFRQASQLGEQADVRISGVPVGKVVKVGPGPHNSTRATLQLDARYAPARQDMRALVRTKTLLGEAYVELTPGRRSAPPIPEGGRLAPSQVQNFVALDEIFRSFDARTRESFQVWMQAMALGYRGRERDISNAFGNLVPFTQDADALTQLLNEQSADVRKVVHDTGIVFAALSHRQDQLQGLIRAGNTTFNAIGRSNTELAQAFRLLPTFERQTQATLPKLDAFADLAQPVLIGLQPAIAEMTPTFQELERSAPVLEGTLDGVRAITKASVKGFPALVDITQQLRTLFSHLSPTLRNLEPMLTWAGKYGPDIQAFFANLTAASLTNDKPATTAPLGTALAYRFRATPQITPLAISAYSTLIGSSRANAYGLPGTDQIAGSQEVFNTRACTRGDPVIPTSTPAQAELTSLLTNLGVTRLGSVGESATVAAPQCDQQAPFVVDGVSSAYPHLAEAPVTR